MGLKLARFWMLLIGGVLLGGGLVLHGQIKFAEVCREQVQGTFFLWRAIGQVTFVFQDDQTKLALWLNEVPTDVMRESDRAAWTLVIIGGVFAVVSCACCSRRKRARQ